MKRIVYVEKETTKNRTAYVVNLRDVLIFIGAIIFLIAWLVALGVTEARHG